MRVKKSIIGLIFSFIPLLILFLGCGGGGSNSTAVSTQTNGIGSSGGTVTSSDGKVSVLVPQGALSQQTDITVDQATNPPSGNIGVAYEFGPSGTTFSQPVTISITYDQASLPQGVNEADLRLGTVVNGGWEAVSDSTVDVAANKVTGTTTHFSIYGVVAEAAYTSEDLQDTWYSMGIDTPQKGFSDPTHFAFDFDIETLNSDGSGTETCLASIELCTGSETFPSGTISISPDGIITSPHDPSEANDAVMGANKDVFIGVSRDNAIGDKLQSLGVSVKKAASYSMADLAGTWYGMNFGTPLNGFYPTGFGFDFETTAINNDGSATITCNTSSDPCTGPETLPAGEIVISSNGIVTMPFGPPDEARDVVMSANKDIMISLFRQNNTGSDDHQELGILVKKAASYSMSDLAGTWYGMNINTPLKGFSDPAFFGFDFSTTTINSDGSGTTTCNASSDSCTNETFPSGTISISRDGVITTPLGSNEAQDWVMGASRDIMIQIFRNNNTGEEHQVFGVFVKKANS